MADANLSDSWRKTRSHLSHAFALVDDVTEDPDGDSIGQLRELYAEYIDHNELELALDALELVGDRTDMPSKFWKALEDAAMQMGLDIRRNELHAKGLEAAGRESQDSDD